MNFNISPGFVEATATPLFTRFLSGGLLQKTFHDSVPQVTKAFSRWPHIIPFHLEVITQMAQKESPDSDFHPKEKNEPYLFTTVIWIWAPPPGSVRLHKSNLESVKTPISMPNIRWLSQLKTSNQGYARTSLPKPPCRQTQTTLQDRSPVVGILRNPQSFINCKHPFRCHTSDSCQNFHFSKKMVPKPPENATRN